MESPQTSKRKIQIEDESPLSKVNSTPKNQMTPMSADFGLYHLHRESSPNFRAGQDVLEVGWGDSPEPLNVEEKFNLTRTPVGCKKKLDTKESPRSSLPFKRRNVRSAYGVPSKSIIDVSKYVAEVQELSKTIMKELTEKNADLNFNENDKLDACSQRLSPKQMIVEGSSGARSQVIFESTSTSSNIQNKDLNFQSVLENFINEEDDWLSQAVSTQESKTSCKGNFMKSKSDNELFLSLPEEKKSFTQNCRNINNNFRRTSSFDVAKSPKLESLSGRVRNFSETDSKSLNGVKENKSCTQYSLQEIEKKRLEAIYRKERKEIERKKMEALKRLEMKKLRVIKT